MKIDPNTAIVSAQLPCNFIIGLLALKELMDHGVVSALHAALDEGRPIAAIPETKPLAPLEPKRVNLVPHNTNLEVHIFGQCLRGASLADLFAQCVDVINDLDPAAIERLSQKKTHARRYVARRAIDIHIRSPHLKTMQTKSGWWISANVSEQQVITSMRILAEAAEITFGKDLIFPTISQRHAEVK